MNLVRTLCRVLPALPLTIAIACQSPEPPSPGLEGLWLSEGYGLLAEVADTTVSLTEVTAVSCIPREDRLERTGVEEDGSWRLLEGRRPGRCPPRPRIGGQGQVAPRGYGLQHPLSTYQPAS